MLNNLAKLRNYTKMNNKPGKTSDNREEYL